MKAKGGVKKVIRMMREGWRPLWKHEPPRAIMKKGDRVRNVRYRHVKKALRKLGLTMK